MKTFYNAKDCLEYLKNEAKEGEEVELDERATFVKPKKIYYFKGGKQGK